MSYTSRRYRRNYSEARKIIAGVLMIAISIILFVSYLTFATKLDCKRISRTAAMDTYCKQWGL